MPDSAVVASIVGRRVIATLFPDVSARDKHERVMVWDALFKNAQAPKEYTTKQQMPQLKLARFGDVPNAQGCLRHDANVQEIWGVEGDYDGGEMSLGDAAARLAAANVAAILYSSPSCTVERPKWRVLCPCSQACQPSMRAVFVARVNGVLGGVLTPGSFVLSQTYYVGRIAGREYEATIVHGECIDLLPDLDADAMYAQDASTGTTGDAAGADVGGSVPAAPRAPDAFQLALDAFGNEIRSLGELGYRAMQRYVAAYGKRYPDPDVLVARAVAKAQEVEAAALEADAPPTSDEPDLIPDLLQTKAGPRAVEENAVRILQATRLYDTLHYDEFLDRRRWRGRDWSPDDEMATLCALQAYGGGIAFSRSIVRNAIERVASDRRRNMLQGWLESLPDWDGTERIASAFEDGWGAPETGFIRAASANFFIAMIARAMHPGCQCDLLWTFEGLQGIGKSKALRTLGGQLEGVHLHREITAAAGSNDFYRQLQGAWIVELSEMDSLRGREATTVKRILSATHDTWVEKYETVARTRPRRVVFAASTNERQYWSDPTGQRRLVPVPCRELRVDVIESLRVQWFAEAKVALSQGATWWRFPAANEGEAPESRQVGDAWADMLRERMMNGLPAGQYTTAEAFPEGFVSTHDLMTKWLGMTAAQIQHSATNRLASVMRQLNYVPVRKRMGSGERVRGYEPMRTDGSEAEAAD